MPKPSLNPTMIGIVLMTGGALLFSWKDGLTKLTDGHYSPVLIIWLQNAFMTSLWLPIVVFRYGWHYLIPQPLGWQIIRSLSNCIGIGIFYWSISLIPLAEATVMVFTAPLITAILSHYMLREKIGIRRILAIIFGFMGAIILLRPAFSGDSFGYLIAFGTGICLGLFYAVNRKLAHSAPPIASLLYTALIGLLVVTPIIPFKWTAPRPQDTLLILGFLTLVTVAQSMLISSFRFTNANILAPFTYMQIVGATFFGFIYFNELPDGFTWIGIGIVVLSGCYIALRENK